MTKLIAIVAGMLMMVTFAAATPAQAVVNTNRAGRELLLDTWYDMGSDDQVNICIRFYLDKTRFVNRFRASLDRRPRRMLSKADIRRVFNYVCDELADSVED